jgi:hypothetical protein
MLQVLRLKGTSRRIDGIPVAADFPTMMESGAITTPMTAGLLKPAILLPCNWRNWDEWKLRAVLVHEHCHVLRGDWAVAVAAAFIRCVFWFNPLVWWIERRLSLLAEHACDEASVCRLGDAPRYAETLLDFASSLKHERRWIGGVAMAQHRISRRINRVLTLRTFDSGLVPRGAWIVISVLALPVMYFSAVSPQAVRQNIPSLTTMEMLNAVRNRLPQIPDIAMAQTPQQAPAAPAATPQSRAAEAGTPQTPTTPQTPAVNPDLVEEIRLILAPANAQASEVKGEVELTLERGTNRRYTGGVVWNTNPGVNTWNTNQGAYTLGPLTFWKGFSPNMLSPGFWDQNTSLLLVLSRVEGRAVTFQTGDGRGFTFGCPDCSFHVGESGVGAPNQGNSGIVFRLSADGLSMTATCRAAECRMGTSSQVAANPAAGRFPGVSFVTLQDGQSISFGVHTSTANPPQNRVCFSVFGAVKADGRPFTAADCPDGAALLPEAVLFTFTR